jgi:hypothetical protein
LGIPDILEKQLMLYSTVQNIDDIDPVGPLFTTRENDRIPIGLPTQIVDALKGTHVDVGVFVGSALGEIPEKPTVFGGNEYQVEFVFDRHDRCEEITTGGKFRRKSLNDPSGSNLTGIIIGFFFDGK